MGMLRIRNFGAIKEADFNLKKVNVFIGHTSTGKSTAAKLLAIFNSLDLLSIPNGNSKSFQNLLKKYEIDFSICKDSEIYYEQNGYSWTIGKDKFETNNKDADILNCADKTELLKRYRLKIMEGVGKGGKDTFNELMSREYSEFLEKVIINWARMDISKSHQFKNPIYIPAERLLISIFSNSMFSLLEAGAAIPECISRFGALYEKARRRKRTTNIDILNIKVDFRKGNDTITMPDNERVNLKQASSGILSILPLWMILEDNLKKEADNFVVIEEPELNLYPTVQLDLVNWIIGKMKNTLSNIVITTHSPYILTAIDNLIMGYDIYHKTSGKDESSEKLSNLLPIASLIDFDDVSSYFFADDGVIKDILDKETRSVGAEYLDEASERTSNIFNELCNLL